MTLSPEELLLLFSLLKERETHLKTDERHLLIKIEKYLYEHVSIADIENRLGGLIEKK